MKKSSITDRKLVERKYSGRAIPVSTLSIPRKVLKYWKKGQFKKKVQIVMLEYNRPKYGEYDRPEYDGIDNNNGLFKRVGIRKGDCVGLLIIPDYSPLLIDKPSLFSVSDGISDELSDSINQNMLALATKVMIPGAKRNITEAVLKTNRYIQNLGYELETNVKPEEFDALFYENFVSNIDLKELPLSRRELQPKGSKGRRAESKDIQKIELIQACRNADTRTIRKLLYKGIDLNNVQDETGRTVLELAIEDGRGYVIPLLLNGGADANAKDENGYTPLHRAIRLGQTADIINALIEHGADVNAKDKYGITPLHIALETGNYDLARELIQKYGANVHSRDKSGKTPLDLLSMTEKGCKELLGILKKTSVK